MQQQVYNTAREQQVYNTARGTARGTASLYDTLLIILLKSLHRNKFRRHTGFFSFLRIVFMKISASWLGPVP